MALLHNTVHFIAEPQSFSQIFSDTENAEIRVFGKATRDSLLAH